MMQHPIALQLRNLQTLVEISVDKNSTIVFPAPLMSAVTDLVSFLTRGTAVRPLAERASPDATEPGGRSTADPDPSPGRAGQAAV